MKVNLQNLKKGKKQSTQLQKILKINLEGDYLKDLTEKDIGKLLQNIYFIIGANEQNILTGDKNILLINLIKSRYANWTKQEISYAFQLAIEGKLINVKLDIYDKPFNILYLSKILNEYKRQFRSEAKIKHNQQIMEEEKELTPAQKQKIIINGVLTCFENYKKEKNIVDLNNVTCKFLNKIELINWDEQQIKELKKITRQERKQELINFKEDSTLTEIRKYYDELLLNFEKNIKTSKTSQANLNRIYFILSLKKYFDELIEFDLDLEELIKDKIK